MGSIARQQKQNLIEQQQRGDQVATVQTVNGDTIIFNNGIIAQNLGGAVLEGDVLPFFEAEGNQFFTRGGASVN